MATGVALAALYDYHLVAIPASVSAVAAYFSLDLAERAKTDSGRARLASLLVAAVAMGTGIWASRYNSGEEIQPLAPVLYDWPTVLLSFLAALIASGLALWIVSRTTPGLVRTAAGGLVMGAGIASRFYIGMEALRLQTVRSYSPGLAWLCLVLPIAVSFVVLRLVFAHRQDRSIWAWRKLLGAVLLGLAITATSRINLAAVTLMPGHSQQADLVHAVGATSLRSIGTLVAMLIILGLVLLTSRFERKLTLQTQRLAESEGQLQAIFESLTEGIVVLDHDMKIVRMNRAAIRILGSQVGTSSIEQVADSLEVFLPGGEPLAHDERPSLLAFQGKFLQSRELRLYRKDTGKSVICEVSTAPIADPAGEVKQIILSYRDVTERRQVDESRKLLAAIVESSEDAIIGLDPEGAVTTWNRGAEKIFGYQAAEMIGQSILRLLPSGREHEEDDILARIRNGETVEHIDTLRKRKDGQLIHVSLSVSPIRDAGNHVVGASKIARDITEKKQLERQLQQSQKMEAIGQLTGGIAHDFNNLLAIVIGNLGLLERMLSGNDAAMKRVQTALKAAGRGADLNRRLLAFSSQEELKPTAIRLEDSIHNVIELADRALGPEIRVSTRFDQSVPAVFVDAGGLESALLNLTVNARDAMPKGGTLTITTKLSEVDESYPPVQTGELKRGTYACVSVSDTGHGMSQQTMERAFEPFFTTKPRDKGTGLGLAMVYGFAKQSGGTVRLYSEQGYGTTVSLFLPLAQELKRAADAPQSLHAPGGFHGYVLLVDDEPDLLEIANAYLTEMGYTVVQAENGASALEAAKDSEKIDLLVTDVIMPGGMNGAELAQRVRQLSPDTKVIFTSGFPSHALAERSGTTVDGPLLRKPYQRAEFVAMIHRTMEDAMQRWSQPAPSDAGAGI
jgi:PAS domain S-box-containing protein